MSTDQVGKKGDVLLEMKDVVIDGFSDDRWHEIIKKVDLTVKRGEVVGIIGESGAGKSTIGNAIINLIEPPGKIINGEILFQEEISLEGYLSDIFNTSGHPSWSFLHIKGTGKYSSFEIKTFLVLGSRI